MANFRTDDEFNPRLYTTRPFERKVLSQEEVEALLKDYTEHLQQAAILIAGDEVLCLANNTHYSFS